MLAVTYHDRHNLNSIDMQAARKTACLQRHRKERKSKGGEKQLGESLHHLAATAVPVTAPDFCIDLAVTACSVRLSSCEVILRMLHRIKSQYVSGFRVVAYVKHGCLQVRVNVLWLRALSGFHRLSSS